MPGRYTIILDFRKFGEVHVSDFLTSFGLYVIWDSRAIARPTYIGQGIIPQRLPRHIQRSTRELTRKWDGYIATISGSTRRVHELEAQAAESILLFLADDLDCRPRLNKKSGSLVAVRNFCESETLRIVVDGYNPFQPPHEARPLTQSKILDVTVNDDGNLEVKKTNWRLRRLRMPVCQPKVAEPRFW